MGVNYGPSIATSDLALYLDAGNSRSYPGTGTVWTDLSGNSRNGTLTNGPTYSSTNGGSIVFDGTNDEVLVSGSLTTSAATFITWLKRNGSQGSFDGILFSRSTNVSGMGFTTSNLLGYTWNSAANTFDWNSGLTIPDAAWCMCAITVSASSATAYLGQSTGITSATNTVSHTSTTLDDLRLARDEEGSRYYNGNIAAAMLYNRALSADEITQNFNALRGRFGL